jgi:oligopeptide transport system permease protein
MTNAATPARPTISESPTRRALKRFRKNRLAIWSLGYMILVTLVSSATVGWNPAVRKLEKWSGRTITLKLPDPTEIHKGDGFRPPGWAEGETRQEGASSRSYKLGTDELGRDLLIRLLHGGLISLMVGFVATVVALAIGVTWGLLAGFVGGLLDQLLMRIVDILYSLPYMFFVILLAAVSSDLLGGFEKYAAVHHRWFGWILVKVQSSGDTSAYYLPDWLKTNIMIFVLFIAIGAVSWLTMSRIVRGQVLSLKEKEFVEAARALGVPLRRILFTHVLPNCLGPIIVYATLTIAVVILEESFLSFIGLGVQPPFASWGTLAADGAQGISVYATRWWLVLFPGLMITSTLMAINFVGDGLRDAFDPRLSR